MLTLSWSLVVVCWGLFGLVWVLGWLTQLRQAQRVQQRATLLSLWLPALGAVIIAEFVPSQVWNHVTAHVSWLALMGMVILIPATLLALWARFSLGMMWSHFVETTVGHQLRVSGPYRLTRHPIYTGVLGMLIGSLLITGFGIWIVYGLAGGWIVIRKMQAEERLLQATFGDAYQRYRRQVPQLIPGLPRFPSP
jgi:protein-S-isoprenylcysteine O-methyltransferase Ste14